MRGREFDSYIPHEREEDRKEFFSRLYQVAVGTYTAKEIFSQLEIEILEYLMLLEIVNIGKRQIIFITNDTHFYCGTPQPKSPLLIGKGTNSHHVILKSENSYLTFPPTLTKSLEQFPTNTILRILEKSLKKDTDNIKIRPISFNTKKFSITQQKYPIWIKELIGVVENLKFFKNDTLDTPTILLSDNKPSLEVISNKKVNSSVINSVLYLDQDFSHIKFCFVKGKSNLSDFWSRPDFKDTSLEGTANILPIFVGETLMQFKSYGEYLDFNLKKNEKEIIEESPEKCNNLRGKYEERTKIFDDLLSYNNFRKATLNDPNFNRKEYEERNGLFFKNQKLFLPQALEYPAISRTHLELGHVAGKRIYDILRETYAVSDNKSLENKCKKYGKSCINCLMANSNKLGYKQGVAFPYVNKPNQYISADCFYFTYEIGSSANLHSQQALIVIDHYSQKVSTFLLGRANDDDLIRCLTNYFSQNSIVEKILSDNGSNFRSLKFKKFLETVGITQVDSAPYSSRARGLIENSIGRIRRLLRAIRIDCPNYSPQLLLIIATNLMNACPNIGSGSFSPNVIHEMTKGLDVPFLTNRKNLTMNSYRREINLTIRSQLNRRRREKERTRKRENMNRVGINLKNGDICVIRCSPSHNKNLPLFDSGLYTVEEVFSNSVLLKRNADHHCTLRHPAHIKKIGELLNNDIPNALKPHLKIINFSDKILKDCSDLLEKENELQEKIVTRSKRKELEKQLEEKVEDDDEDEWEEIGDTPIKKSVRFDL